jgi:hypothetical protein
MCLPKGQEAELAGFYVYCTQILGWLPPLLFTICVQANIDQKYGVIVTSFGFMVSVLLLSCTGSWEEIVKEAEQNQDIDFTEDHNVDKSIGLPGSVKEIETIASGKKGSEEEEVDL